MELLISFLWLVLKIVVIWAIAYLCRMGLDMLKGEIPPAPVKSFLKAAIYVVAVIVTIIVIITWLSELPGGLPGF